MTMKSTIPAFLLALSVFNTLGAQADTAKTPDKPPVIVEQAKVLSTAKLSKVESLALQSLNDRQRLLQQDITDFSSETCKAHGVPVDTCSIDPTSLSISNVEKPKPNPAPEKK